MQKRTIRVLDSDVVASSNDLSRGAANGAGSDTVYFGVFELDLRTGQLRRNGSRVKLQSSHSKYWLSFLKSRVMLLHEMIYGSGCGRLIRSSILITASTLLFADSGMP